MSVILYESLITKMSLFVYLHVHVTRYICWEMLVRNPLCFSNYATNVKPRTVSSSLFIRKIIIIISHRSDLMGAYCHDWRHSPANTEHLYNIYTMLDQCRRRVFAGRVFLSQIDVLHNADIHRYSLHINPAYFSLYHLPVTQIF